MLTEAGCNLRQTLKATNSDSREAHTAGNSSNTHDGCVARSVACVECFRCVALWFVVVAALLRVQSSEQRVYFFFWYTLWFRVLRGQKELHAMLEGFRQMGSRVGKVGKDLDFLIFDFCIRVDTLFVFFLPSKRPKKWKECCKISNLQI